VATSTLGSELLAVAEVRVHGLGLLDDEAILDELADVLAYNTEMLYPRAVNTHTRRIAQGDIDVGGVGLC
jgi:hypothetical protein